MDINKKHEELLESSYKELEKFTGEVNQLSDIRKKIEGLIKSNTDLPPLIHDLLDELKKLTDTYVKNYKNIALENDKSFKENLKTLNENLNEISDLITRLSNINFTGHFEDLQTKFLELAKSLFDSKINELKQNIDKFEEQIKRLESIDLEEHFEKLQEVLSQIFGAINAINITITSITQILNNIVQSIGNLQLAIDRNHQDINQHFRSLNDVIFKNNEQLNENIKSLKEENTVIRRSLKLNKIITITGTALIIVGLITIILRG